MGFDMLSRTAARLRNVFQFVGDDAHIVPKRRNNVFCNIQGSVGACSRRFGLIDFRKNFVYIQIFRLRRIGSSGTPNPTNYLWICAFSSGRTQFAPTVLTMIFAVFPERRGRRSLLNFVLLKIISFIRQFTVTQFVPLKSEMQLFHIPQAYFIAKLFPSFRKERISLKITFEEALLARPKGNSLCGYFFSPSASCAVRQL